MRGRGRGHTGPGPYTQAGGARSGGRAAGTLRGGGAPPRRRAARHAVRPPGTEYRGRLFLPRPSPRMKFCGGFWAVLEVYL